VTRLAGALLPPRRAVLRRLRRADGTVLDTSLVLWFPAPGSYTGEDVAELHVHGGRAVLEALFAELGAGGLRMAEPGEFTRRAFLNGRLDLTEAEGIADLVAAETEMQRRQALAAAGGALARQAETWREALIDLRAAIEARLDFADEGDVPPALPPRFAAEVGALIDAMAAALAGAAAAERVREGFRVAILGRPNAGKSSLLNALARRDVAIVTPEAGTTRDVLEVPLDLGGYAVVLFDTAGLRETQSAAEAEGVARARRAAEAADLILWLSDVRGPAAPDAALAGRAVWRVATKVDLAPGGADAAQRISVVSGEGIDALLMALARAAAEAGGTGNALVTRRRQAEAIAAALAALRAFDGVPDELAADLLRSASAAIGRLSGRVDVEDVLDRLFAAFCIGK
jgi:tRNA modification GTPase